MAGDTKIDKNCKHLKRKDDNILTEHAVAEEFPIDFPLQTKTKRIKLPKISDSKPASDLVDKTDCANLSPTPTITVKSSNNTRHSRAWDKRYYCVYCEKPFAKIPRHLEDRHKSEADVAKLITLIPTKEDSQDTRRLKFQLRKNIIDELRRKRNYNHNISVLQKGHGELIVKRCPPKKVSYTSFLPCEYCSTISELRC